MAWYRNLIECMGDELTIHVVSRIPLQLLASSPWPTELAGLQIWVLRLRFNNLGGTPFCSGKRSGSQARGHRRIRSRPLRSGRPGTGEFQGPSGSAESELNYYRYSTASPKDPSARRERSRLRQIFARMPDAIFTGVGRLLYRHMGLSASTRVSSYEQGVSRLLSLP